VIHSYSGGAELVPIYEALGLHLSFGGAVTWAGARRPVEALRRVSPHRLLLESDGPDQRPRFTDEDPAWGPQSEPSMLPNLCRAVEALRGAPVAAQVERNALELGW
jgi:TatD DNase family protein